MCCRIPFACDVKLVFARWRDFARVSSLLVAALGQTFCRPSRLCNAYYAVGSDVFQLPLHQVLKHTMGLATSCPADLESALPWISETEGCFLGVLVQFFAR